MKKVLMFMSVYVFFMVGCASTVKSLKPGEPVTEKNGYSYIYGSCKRPYLGIFAEFFPPDLNMYVKLDDSNVVNERFKLAYRTEKMNNKGLFVFKVKPGKYMLYTMEIKGYAKTFEKKFEVREGSGYYLGYVNFDRDFLNIIGNSLSITISNDNEFDKNELISKYPELSELKFENLIIK